ncbi:hypothetical protein BC937DRAFT_91440 [Endogone sp. FLAS-F59071]|nr:hypothetical protein BC937DRAFT_91440 [Endogone sp. FLAS-F59071]|eukprot:RUS21798.1 hypothetical protein BC937DRAFT_91440 [Endogone sp. FLAS-F59071]
MSASADIPKFYLPFYYASLENCWIFFKASPSHVEPLLKNKHLKPYIFEDGHTIVGLCFQQFSSHNATTVTELEFQVASFPESQEGLLGERRWSEKEFLKGSDQAKILGFNRVVVLASNLYAVEAGKILFGENKYLTTFDSTWPGLDAPPQQREGWHFTVYDPENPNETIFSINVSVGAILPVPANPAPLTLYDIKEGRLSCSKWNIYGAFDTYFFDDSQADNAQVKIEYGNSNFEFGRDMRTAGIGLLGSGTRPFAIQSFQSPPVAVQSFAYYVRQ